MHLKIMSFVLALMLAGCAASPGMVASGLGDKSAVTLAPSPDSDRPPENVSIQRITAELILEKERSQTVLAEDAGPLLAPTLPYEYRLGPGDILSIIVWDHPELTIPAGSFRSAEQAGTVVNEDGTIYFPYAGVVKVAGKTLGEVRAMLTRKLERYVENLQLDVRIAAFRSQRVYVVGEVVSPGVREITDIPPTVIEMINRSSGFTDESDRRNITLSRDGQTHRIDVLSLYEDGNTHQNVALRAGDVLNVPDRKHNKVFVLGEVNQPGSYIMNKGRKTLAEALGDAGDINQATANPQQIYVMRGGKDDPEVYHLDSRTPDALLLADRFPLIARDVVYVDTAEVVRWNRVISRILPTAATLRAFSATSFPLFQGGGN